MANEVEIRVKVDGNGAISELRRIEREVKASTDNQKSTWDKFGSTLQTGFISVLKGLGGAVGGGAALGLAAPIAAAGLAMTAFGAVAIPVLNKVSAASSQYQAAQLRYSQATTAAGRQAALNAEQAAIQNNNLTKAQVALLGPVNQLQTAFGALQDRAVPAIGALLNIATELMPAFGGLVSVGGRVLEAFVAPLQRMVSSPFFAQFIAQMNQLAIQVGPLLAQTLVQLLKVFMQLIMQAGPAGVKALSALLPVLVQIVSGLVPFIAGVTKIVAAILQWLTANHLLIPALIAVGAAMAIAGGSFGLIAAGVALVVGGLIHLWQTSLTFREIVTAAFSVVGQVVLTIAQIWITEMHVMADFFLNMAHDVLNAAYLVAKGLDMVFHTHMADAVRSAQHSLDDFKNSVDNAFNAANKNIDNWKRDLANMPKVVRLEGNISDLTAKLNNAKAQLRDPNLTRARRAQIQADISNLERQLASARAQLNAINGTVATTYVTTIQVGGGTKTSNQMAHGGIIGAATGGPRSNLTLVGEHGPELLSLPSGSRVFSNADSQRMAGQGGRGQPVVIEFHGSGSGLDALFWTWLKNGVRVQGGDPVMFQRKVAFS